MRVRHRGLWSTALLLGLAGSPAPARAGLADTPLPTFSDGRAAELAGTLAGVIKNNNVETAVVCTNLASAALDVGLEVFDETGALRNAVAAGNGAILNVAPGATVTLGTGPVAVLHEDRTLTLNTAGSGTNNLRNGSGRVVASGAPLGCAAFAVDRLHTIEDPAVCPTCQPPSLTTVSAVAPNAGTTTSTVLPMTTTTVSSTTTSTAPRCTPPPQARCRKPTAPRAASLVMRDRAADDLDQLAWKWSSGAATAKADFGNPLSTTSYRLCVYDVAGGAPGLRMSATAPAGAVCEINLLTPLTVWNL